jgi:DNA gyrase/topoisomerase IV subunit A
VGKLSTVEAGGEWAWEEAALPDEPRAGETLVCIAPFSHLPVSDFFLQVSRRGNVKRTMTSMAQNVLSNHYIGKGALKKADQPFDLTLCNAGARLAFVTYEGKLLGLEIDDLSYTIEARITMSASDYVIASFLPRPEDALIFVTQMGKVLHRAGSVIETTKSAAAKGQALISANRLGQGVRFMGAAAVQDSDRVAVLDAGGQVVIYEANAMTGSGSIGSGELILSIGVIPSSFSGGGEPSNS